ncbi:MAG: RnfABCDGE type electron transport complex subunit B, partial [Spirochaetia bacterium]|nr:RnfABCDGE type electron transport complex subunit B [Spirochaetia bacterium]
MVQNIIFACIIVTALGALFGAGLSIAAKHFAVKKDEKLEALEAALPGYNCGSCGFAGCSGYAEAIFNGSVTELTKCAPGAAKSAARIAEIMGVAIDLSAEKMVAHCHCRGDNENAVKAMNYKGIEDCNAAFAMFQGYKACKYGCLGFGSCIKVCPAGAISKTGTGLVQVDKEKCISCGACTKVCPTHAMRMIPISASHVVDCNS